MKFTECMLNIFLALTVLSSVSFSESRRSSSKSRKTPEDASEGVSKLTKYQAKLQIKHLASLKEFDIKMDLDSFDRMNYGIEFSIINGAIIDDAFFLVSPNVYLFNLKHTHGLSCLNQAMFTQDSMHFLVANNNGINYEVNFIFPNG
jgi:hypothetical protein